MNEFWRKLLDQVNSNDYISTFADPARTIVGIESYSYSVDYSSAGVPVTNVTALFSDVIMDSDSDFVLTYLSGAANVAGVGNIDLNPTINIQITDRASSRTWFNQPSPMPFVAGAGGFPFLVTSPRVIKPRSTLRVSYTGIYAGVSYSCFALALHGAKIYYA